MLDTSQWPQIELDVLKGVHLDPKNVRLEAVNAKVEADIIEDLFVNEGALGLVEGICKIGYLTHEVPVVLRRDGTYITVEGNRRIAALKAIQNPMLVPKYRARIALLAESLPDRSVLANIHVMVAPSQEEADQLVAAIHTGNLRKRWNPSRQSAFFQAQINAGRTFKELVTRYPTIDVKEFVFRARIINLFESVQYDDAELEDFQSSKKWARGLSTLSRIYESKPFQELTGLAIDDDGNVTMSISDTVFRDVATAIVRGMAEGNINTRSLNTIKSPRYTQLMADLRRIVTDANEPVQAEGTDSSGPTEHSEPGTAPSRGSSFAETSDSSGSSTSAGRAPGTSDSTKTTQPSTRKTKSKNLELGQINPPDVYPEALKLLLGELSEIDVRKFPNATFLMIRAVLEKSIKAFADAKCVDIRKTRHNNGGRVQLSHALDWLLDHVKNDHSTYMIQVIEKVRTGRLVPYTNSRDALNAANHNHLFSVDADQARDMWTSIDPILRYLMKP